LVLGGSAGDSDRGSNQTIDQRRRTGNIAEQKRVRWEYR